MWNSYSYQLLITHMLCWKKDNVSEHTSIVIEKNVLYLPSARSLRTFTLLSFIIILARQTSPPPLWPADVLPATRICICMMEVIVWISLVLVIATVVIHLETFHETVYSFCCCLWKSRRRKQRRDKGVGDDGKNTSKVGFTYVNIVRF